MNDHPAPKTQDTSVELDFQARQAGMFAAITATPAATIERYRQHRNWRFDNRECVFRHAHKYGGKRVCDFGCGAGETSTELGLMDFNVVGFDLSPELIELAQRRAKLDQVESKVRFFIGDALQLQTEAAQFDSVVCMGVLHHLVDVREALQPVEALLKPGGYLILQEPIAFSPMLQKLRDRTPVPKDISPNERQLVQHDIDLVEAKFEVVEKRYFLLFSRLRRLVPDRWPGLQSKAVLFLGAIDCAVLTCLPFMRRFAGALVMVCRKR